MNRHHCHSCGVTADKAELRRARHDRLYCGVCFGDDELFEQLPMLIEAPQPANLDSEPHHAA